MLDKLDVGVLKIIGDDQAQSIAQNWLSIYCKHRTSFKGIRGGKTYLWDEIHSQFQNSDALEKYESHSAPSYYVIPDNFDELEKRVYVCREKPQGNPFLADFHIFPKNFSWSMVFNHEDAWIGPKFFMHPNYEKLNKVNEKAIKEISRAGT